MRCWINLARAWCAAQRDGGLGVFCCREVSDELCHEENINIRTLSPLFHHKIHCLHCFITKYETGADLKLNLGLKLQKWSVPPSRRQNWEILSENFLLGENLLNLLFGCFQETMFPAPLTKTSPRLMLFVSISCFFIFFQFLKLFFEKYFQRRIRMTASKYMYLTPKQFIILRNFFLTLVRCWKIDDCEDDYREINKNTDEL